MYLKSILFAIVIISFDKCAESFNVGGLCFNEGATRELPLCSRYLECENGHFVLKKCIAGKIFDHDKKQCVASFQSKTHCNNRCTFNDKKPVKGSQAKYVYCDKGELKIGLCNGNFNRFTKMCEENKITLKKTMNFNHEDSLKSIDLNSKCKTGRKITAKGSCGNFLECIKNGTWDLKKCPDCQTFNPNSMECVWAWKYNCGSSFTTDHPVSVTPISTDKLSSTTFYTSISTPQSSINTISTTVTTSPTVISTLPVDVTTSITPATSDITTTIPTQTTPTSITTTSSTPSPKCVEGKTKIYQKGDCKDYLQCVSGKWVKKSCSLAYDFDINKLECVFSWWAQC